MRNLPNAGPARRLVLWLAFGTCLLLSPHLTPQQPKLRATCEGQTGWVWCVAISPDGNTVASGSADIQLWSAASGKEKATLKAAGYGVYSVAFSPNSKTLASGTVGNMVKVWDVGTGKGITLLDEVPPPKVQSILRFARPLVVFSPDGKTLASGGRCLQEIHLWDVTTAKQTTTLEGHGPFGLSALVFSPDGKTLVSAGLDNSLKLWDVATGKNTITLKTDESFLAAFTSDGKILATSDYDSVEVGGRDVVKGWVKLWDVATGKEKTLLKGHTAKVCSMTFSPDSKTLAFGGEDGVIKLWDVVKDKELATLKGHSNRHNVGLRKRRQVDQALGRGEGEIGAGRLTWSKGSWAPLAKGNRVDLPQFSPAWLISFLPWFFRGPKYYPFFHKPARFFPEKGLFLGLARHLLL